MKQDIEIQEKNIDGSIFYAEPLNYIKQLRLKNKFISIIASCFESVGEVDLNDSIDIGLIAKAAASLDSDEFTEFMLDTLQLCRTDIDGDGKRKKLTEDNINLFAWANGMQIYKVFAFIIEVNCGDFLELLQTQDTIQNQLTDKDQLVDGKKGKK